MAKKDYESQHGELDMKNLYVVKACQSLTSRGYLRTQFSWQWYYYSMTSIPLKNSRPILITLSSHP